MATTMTKATTAVAATTITIIKIAAEMIVTRTKDAMTDDTTLAMASHKTKSTEDAIGVRLEANTQMSQNQIGTLDHARRFASHEKYAKPDCPKDSS